MPEDPLIWLARLHLRMPSDLHTWFESKELLANFSEYCAAHPEERFWEALRNWSNVPFLIASHQPPSGSDAVDTFPLKRQHPFVS